MPDRFPATLISRSDILSIEVSLRLFQRHPSLNMEDMKMTSLKVHLALNTDKFSESVSFYKSFFGKDPVKLKPGYAKFDIENPALNFTLNEGPVSSKDALNHLGIQVHSTDDVVAATARLKAAGLLTREEVNTDCCYALQDKVWVKDPNGYDWEVFTVKVADTRPELQTKIPASSVAQASCCK
jgi:catechol 2,3-dioxygenase-like lactoylglutathione lyase family enzyme